MIDPMAIPVIALRVALVAVGTGLEFLMQSLLHYLPAPEGMI